MAGPAQELDRLRRALGRKAAARENLSTMLEEPDFDRVFFARQMAKIKDEMGTLEAQVADVENRLAALERARASHEDLLGFIRGNAAWFRDVADRIDNLEPQGKQKLTEALLDGQRIVVEYAEETQTWLMKEPVFRFGPEALRALIDVGALAKVYPD